MSFELFLVTLLAVPAAAGWLLPRPVRRMAMVVAAAAAVALYAAGLNMHGPSTPLFMLCAGIAVGLSLADLGSALRLWLSARRQRMAAHG